AGVCRPCGEVAQRLLAGGDCPSAGRELRERVTERRWAGRVRVGNDTLAVLRAGTERGWGIAVVCGAGINCVGVAPDGREARFPALGAITGDWGGGHDVGAAALSAAARSEDGRGDQTTLEQAVPAHFGLRAPREVAEAIHRGHLEERRVIELAPIVFAEAGHDEVAAGIVARLADEVATMARVALQRLDLAEEPVEVLLGGGLVRAGDGALLAAVEAGLREGGPSITVRAAASPPVVGSALLRLDPLRAGPAAPGRPRPPLQG